MSIELQSLVETFWSPAEVRTVENMKTVFVLTYLTLGAVLVLTNWLEAIAKAEATLKDFLKPTQILRTVMYVIFWLPILVGAGIHLLIVQNGRMKKVK